MAGATAAHQKEPKSDQIPNVDDSIVIRFSRNYKVQGFEILLNANQAYALPNDTYVVGPEQVALLERAGVPFESVAR